MQASFSRVIHTESSPYREEDTGGGEKADIPKATISNTDTHTSTIRMEEETGGGDVFF